ENNAVTAQCGITLGELKGKVNERGWDIHSADMPLMLDSVGGQISGFGGGGWGRYGHSVGYNHHFILGLKVVLPNGSVIDTGTGEGSWSTYQGKTWGRALHAPDFTGMFICDGGIFGLKVETTYRMFRLPKFQKSGVRFWDNLDEAYQALWEMWEIDPYLYMQPYAKVLLISPESVAMFGSMFGAPAIGQKWCIYWLCVGNSEEEIELKAKTTEAIFAKHGGEVLEPPAGPAVVEFLELIEWEVGKLASVGVICGYFELLVSRRDMLECHKWMREFMFNAMRKRGIDIGKRVLMPGTIMPTGTGCGLSAYDPLVDENDREAVRALYEAWLEFFEQARRRGYVMENSHGHQAKLRAKTWTPEFYNFALTLKKTLDPNNIMNPGVHFE
ncbi:FAD-binding oxidoreductase, partial [Chloroflexota bacterium]